jgi:hypothetical protein
MTLCRDNNYREDLNGEDYDRDSFDRDNAPAITCPKIITSNGKFIVRQTIGLFTARRGKSTGQNEIFGGILLPSNPYHVQICGAVTEYLCVSFAEQGATFRACDMVMLKSLMRYSLLSRMSDNSYSFSKLVWPMCSIACFSMGISTCQIFNQSDRISNAFATSSASWRRGNEV